MVNDLDQYKFEVFKCVQAANNRDVSTQRHHKEHFYKMAALETKQDREVLTKMFNTTYRNNRIV